LVEVSGVGSTRFEPNDRVEVPIDETWILHTLRSTETEPLNERVDLLFVHVIFGHENVEVVGG
jgi:hypothetical protein